MNFKQWLSEQTIPIGDCFRFANNLARQLSEKMPDKQVIVCHGIVVEPFALDPNPHIHAWVEANGNCYDWQLKTAGKHFLPIKDFYELFKPKKVKRYDAHQAMVQQLKAKHHGPWH